MSIMAGGVRAHPMTIDSTWEANGGERGLVAQSRPAFVTAADADVIDVEPNQTAGAKPGVILWRRGSTFTWIEPEIVPSAAYSEVRAAADKIGADRFFETEIPPTANPMQLYESVEADFIAERFGRSDGNFLATLASFQHAINGNVLNLSILFSLLTLIALLAGTFGSGLLALSQPLVVGDIDFQNLDPGLIAELEVLFCGAAIFLMCVLFFTQYRYAQGMNGQQLSNYLTRYFAGINSDFVTIERNAALTVVSDRDTGEMKENTVLWWSALQWTAQRAFFLECYLRNVAFRIARNSAMYLALVPLAVAVAVLSLLALGIAFDVLQFTPGNFHGDNRHLLLVIVVALFTGFSFSATAPVRRSIQSRGWYTYQRLEFRRAMKNILEGYVDQLHLWQTMNKPNSR